MPEGESLPLWGRWHEVPEGVNMLHYEHKNVERARSLRRNMTRQERHLWYDFLSGFSIRFFRQKPIGKYIVDFYCSKAKLVIELDGGQHFEENGIKYDYKRTEYLESLGLKVLRFSNLDIDRNFREVCEMITKEVEGRTPPGA